jgi:hypothetical protein
LSGPVFFDELVSPFFAPVGGTFRSTLVRGQIARTFVGYPTENLQLWRPVATDRSSTSATDFRITAAGEDAFRRAMPLKSPPLTTNEEFIVAKAKRRPVIMASPAPPDPKIPSSTGRRVHRAIALVIPLFSLVNDVTGRAKLPEAFIDRVRMLEFPEFLYLPPAPGVLPLSSLARLSEMRPAFEAHLERLDCQLAPDVQRVLEGQLQFLVAGVTGTVYHDYREELLHQEPREPPPPRA